MSSDPICYALSKRNARRLAQIANSSVKAVAHRGYSVEAPENTIPAYIMAAKKGFDYVECDVSFTKDNVAVLLHDATIDRTSNGTGNINELTYSQLCEYDFGGWKSETYAGTKIPRFKEFIELCRGLGLHPYIELKSNGEYTEEQIVEIVEIVKASGMRGKVTYISFSPTYLGYIKNADSHARLGYLTDIGPTPIATALSLKTEFNEVFIDAGYASVDDVGVKLCISNNLPLEVWTVNDADVMGNLDTYISGVTSDKYVAGEVLYDKYTSNVPAVNLSISEQWLNGSANITSALGKGQIISSYPYYISNNYRYRYCGLELAVSPNDVISVSTSGSMQFQWGIRELTQEHVDAVVQGKALNNLPDSGWITNDWTISDGTVCIWIVFARRNATGMEFDIEDLGEVILTKK